MIRMNRSYLPFSGLLLLAGGVCCALMLLLPEAESPGTDRRKRQDEHQPVGSAPLAADNRNVTARVRSPRHPASPSSGERRLHTTPNTAREQEAELSGSPESNENTSFLPGAGHSPRRLSSARTASRSDPGHRDPGVATSTADTGSSTTSQQPDRGSVPPEPSKLPIAFSLPEMDAEPGSLEEVIIRQAQQDFADEMAASPDGDPASPGYADHWKRAVVSHDDYLRSSLGWEQFNRLSALAGQRVHTASASPQ